MLESEENETNVTFLTANKNVCLISNRIFADSNGATMIDAGHPLIGI